MTPMLFWGLKEVVEAVSSSTGAQTEVPSGQSATTTTAQATTLFTEVAALTGTPVTNTQLPIILQ
jgi:hypothetical protein